MTTYTPCAGDVVHYTPTDRWCREGIAIALWRDGRVVLLDTFWGSSGDQHRVTAEEAATAELMFNLADYDELDRYSHQSPDTWAKYAPADRKLITQQHGCQKRWFIRNGAKPDWATQIDNARAEVAKRESAAESALRAVEWAREDLARVLVAAADEENDDA